MTHFEIVCAFMSALRISAVALMNRFDVGSHLCAPKLNTGMEKCSRSPLVGQQSPHPSCLAVFPPPAPCFLDGLVDCMDPDCCSQMACQGQTYCRGSPDPAAIASQGQSSAGQPASKSFYDRIGFLIGPSGSHVAAGENAFNSR